MEVTLHNTDKNLSIAFASKAAAICVGKEDSYSERNLIAAVDSGHLSILEHISLTFYIKDVSRALSHQLVRHRLSSYSQQSQRYCKIDTMPNTEQFNEWYIIPDSIKYNAFALQEYAILMNKIGSIYRYLIDIEGISKEDARMVLPNACKTSLIMTCNLRAFIEQAEKRLCNKAQWEIQELYKLMSQQVSEAYPFIAKLLIPPCGHYGVCKETKPCGKII